MIRHALSLSPRLNDYLKVLIVRKESVEEYLGTIYRLQEVMAAPLPLPRLQERLNYSPISIHEMVQKLEKEGLVDYIPYRGVILTEKGGQVAAALVRRHRIWERFLTDSLGIDWEKAHEIAGELEHAAPETVTERLADFLGSPQEAASGQMSSQPATPALCLEDLAIGKKGQVAFISMEASENLLQLQSQGIQPGIEIEVIGRHASGVTLQVAQSRVNISNGLAGTIWVTEP